MLLKRMACRRGCSSSDTHTPFLLRWFYEGKRLCRRDLSFNLAKIVGYLTRRQHNVGYGVSNLSVWAWIFLFGHLVWATGFMFLISWRGYWQELIETIVWAHERTPLANLVRWKDKPVALSIVQARLVGLAHFTVGYIFTYAAFLIASTAGKFG